MELTMTFQELLDSTEAGEEITRATLRWHYNYMLEENAKILKADSVRPHETQDYANNLKYIEAIKTTLSMFGSHV
jgi:hypothetical protein